MTLSTSLHITEPVNAQEVFLVARRAIGIPAEHPFSISTPALGWANGEWIRSHPDGFRSALDIGHANGSLLVPDLDPNFPEDREYYDRQPPAYVDVRLDTTYGYRGPNGEGCDDVHREVTAAIGVWLDERGIGWWCEDEYAGTWHERTPCPLNKPTRTAEREAWFSSVIDAITTGGIR